MGQLTRSPVYQTSDSEIRQIQSNLLMPQENLCKLHKDPLILVFKKTSMYWCFKDPVK